MCEPRKLYGYYTNGETTFLLVQPDLLEEAKQVFDGTGVQIVTQGVAYLGSAVGQSSFMVPWSASGLTVTSSFHPLPLRRFASNFCY